MQGGVGVEEKEKKTRTEGEKESGEEDGWGGVSRTTVKWLRCYHGDSNEGSQDTPGVWRRRRGLGTGGGGTRESDGEEDWGSRN